MIDENTTFALFDYYPSELKPNSNKRIIVICDSCGKDREIRKSAYYKLCRSCGNTGKKFSKEHKENIRHGRLGKSSGMLNKHHSENTKRQISQSNLGKKRSNETRRKLKISHLGKKCSDKTKEKLRELYLGEKCRFWKGGISFDPYCEKFNSMKKREIRDIYNNCDYISGLHKDICNKGKNCDVHHVDYDKQQGCNEKKFKLIPLSKSNHGKTNYNRPFWNKLFQYSLEIDKEYYKEDKYFMAGGVKFGKVDSQDRSGSNASPDTGSRRRYYNIREKIS